MESPALSFYGGRTLYGKLTLSAMPNLVIRKKGDPQRQGEKLHRAGIHGGHSCPRAICIAFGFGPQLAVLRAYFWIWAQESCLEGFREILW